MRGDMAVWWLLMPECRDAPCSAVAFSPEGLEPSPSGVPLPSRHGNVYT